VDWQQCISIAFILFISQQAHHWLLNRKIEKQRKRIDVLWDTYARFLNTFGVTLDDEEKKAKDD